MRTRAAKPIAAVATGGALLAVRPSQAAGTASPGGGDGLLVDSADGGPQRYG